MPVTPINIDDLVQGAVKYLKTKSDLVNILSSTASGQPWIFQHNIQENVERGLSTALVVADGGSWGGANPHNTARFKRLKIEIWCGPERDMSGGVLTPQEPFRRAEAVFKVLDKHLHWTYSRVAYFGTVLTLASERQGDLSLYSVDDGEHVVKGEVFYGIQI